MQRAIMNKRRLSVPSPEVPDREAPRAAQARQDWDAAIEGWAAVRTACPDAVEAYQEAIHCLASAGRPAEAEALYGLASERFPHIDRFAIEYAWMAHHRRDWDAAIARWRKVHALFPGHLAGFLGGAFSLSAAGRAREADELLEIAQTHEVQNAEVYVAYARQAHHRGDLEVAIERWATVRERHPEHPRGFIEGAACLRDAGLPMEGETVLGDAVVRFPNDLNVAVEYARLAERRGDRAAAIERWAELRSRMPQEDIGFTEGARALLDAGHIEAADALLTDAMESRNDNHSMAFAWAELAVRREAWTEAMNRWSKVRLFLPHQPAGYAQGARVLEALGDSWNRKSFYSRGVSTIRTTLALRLPERTWPPDDRTGGKPARAGMLRQIGFQTKCVATWRRHGLTRKPVVPPKATRSWTARLNGFPVTRSRCSAPGCSRPDPKRPKSYWPIGNVSAASTPRIMAVIYLP